FGLHAAPVQTEDLRAAGIGLPEFDSSQIITSTWSFDEDVGRFSFGRCGDLVNHPRCTILTHAAVTEILVDAGGRKVEHLVVSTLSGRKLEVRARHFVLAAGGIENARLLLASRSVLPSGVGNGYGQVGRHF